MYRVLPFAAIAFILGSGVSAPAPFVILQLIGLIVFILSDFCTEIDVVLDWLASFKSLIFVKTGRKIYCPGRPPTGYPRVYMILSCVMWSMAFVASYTGASWKGKSQPPASLTNRSTAKVPSKPPKLKVVPTDTEKRAIDILLAFEQAEARIPKFRLQSEKKNRQRMHKAMWANNALRPMAFHGNTIVLTTTSAPLRAQLSKMLQETDATLLDIDSAIPIIADTGCSKASSFDPKDFEGPIRPMASPTLMQGIGTQIEVKGEGTIRWTIIDDDGATRDICTTGYLVPAMKFRLFSPQAYIKEKEGCDEFSIKEGAAALIWNNGKHRLTIKYDEVTTLPIFRAYQNVVASAETVAANLSVMDAVNQNLTPGQKDLLKWHQRLGHLGFQWIQWLARQGHLGKSGITMAACDAPLCAACQLGRAKKRPTGSKHELKHPGAGDKMNTDILFPGQAIATDQFSSRVPGRIPGSYGSSDSNSMYKGGTIFVDVATGRTWIYHQVSFNANETIVSKTSFERDCFQRGVGVQNYHGDNGIYNAAEFLRELHDKGQGLKLSGVGAHHQNGISERAIKTIVDRARTLMLHALIHWPDERDETLWPLAVDYSLYLWNNTPKEGLGLSPEELFCSTKEDGTPLLHSHVWGCPAYVLDPKLQDGKKLPKWEPKARRGRFMGMSSDHSSNVGLILNRNTGHITPQFHVVYDDWFETVFASADLEPPEWEDLVNYSRFRNVLDDDFDSPVLNVDWLSDTDKLARRADEAFRREGRDRLARLRRNPTDAPNPEPNRTGIHPPTPANAHDEPPLTETTPQQPQQPQQLPIPAAPVREAPPAITRAGRPTRQPGRFANGATLATTILGCFATQFGLTTTTAESYAFMSIHSRLMDPNTAFLDTIHPWSVTHPMAFALSKGKSDPDNPTLREALMSNYAEEFTEAMATEIAALEKGNTWTPMLRSKLPATANVLPGTWALKIKRYPDGRVRKFKGRYCVRGDKQIKGVDYSETYAPVVAWTTVRMMLVMAATQGLNTTQIDFTNAFVQADIKEDVYIELPAGFTSPADGDYILKLNKNLYGLCQAPKSWFDKLAFELQSLGFVPSTCDPCMFVHPDMIILVYCDDCLMFGKDQNKIDKMIAEMRVKFPGGITVEESVFAFLGVELSQDKKTGKTRLSQSGLTKKILTTTKMLDCHTKRTPALAVTLGSNQFGEMCGEDWDYASVVGMLMYLSSNSRPDIQFAVHQCARFTYAPRKSHEEAIKHICRYLKGTIGKGIEFDPSPEMQLDCYVDADFAGLWGSEDNQDPVCVKSRTGYVLTLGGCPLLWVSRLQTEIALSTLEAEYIALSQAMRDLLPMRRLAKEVSKTLGLPSDYAATMKSTVFEDNNGALGLAISPKLTPRTRHIAVKYHFFKIHIKPGEIEIVKVDTKAQKADIFTKGLTSDTFESIRRILMGW